MKFRFKSLLFFLTLMITSANLLASEKGELNQTRKALEALREKGLTAHAIRMAGFHKGVEPKDFLKLTGAPYKPSYNEMPSIPAQ